MSMAVRYSLQDLHSNARQLIFGDAWAIGVVGSPWAGWPKQNTNARHVIAHDSTQLWPSKWEAAA